MPESSTGRKLRLGIVGIGVGASEILPAMEQMAEFELVAAADINPRVLETFRHRYGAKTYDSVDKLCADPRRRSGLDLHAEPISRAALDHRRRCRQACRRRKTDGDFASGSGADDRGVDQEQSQASVRPHAELRPAYSHHAQDHSLRRTGQALRAACLGVHGLDAPATHGGRAGHQPRRRRALIAKGRTRSIRCDCSAAAWCAVCAVRPDNGSRDGRSPVTIRDF